MRGLGLMLAAEFGAPRAPDDKAAHAARDAAQDERLLLLTCGPYENTIRFVPPLIVNQSQVEDALTIFERALAKV